MPEWAQYLIVSFVVVLAVGFVARKLLVKKAGCGSGSCNGCG